MFKENKIYFYCVLILLSFAILTNINFLKFFTRDGEINNIEIILFLKMLSGFFFILLFIFLLFFKKRILFIKSLIKNKINIALSFFFLIFTLITIELLLQYFNTDQNKNKTIFAKNYEFDATYSYNNLGFRDEKFLFNDKLKIFLIGDSFVFGSAVDSEFTIDKILEEKIKKLQNLKNLNIYNLGISGANISQYFDTFKKFYKYKPDSIFVFLYLDNDINIDFDTSHFSSKINLILVKSKLLNLIKKVINPPHQYYFSDDYLNRFNLSEKYNKIFKNQEANPHLLSLKYRGNYHQYYKKLSHDFLISIQDKNKILQMRDMALAINSEFHLVLIPVKYQVNKKYIKFTSDNFGFKFNDDADIINNQLQELIKKWAKANNLKVIDLLDYMLNDNIDYYHMIDDHYNKNGNKLVSNVLSNIIISNLKKYDD